MCRVRQREPFACQIGKLGKIFFGLAQSQFIDRTCGGCADDGGNRTVLSFLTIWQRKQLNFSD